MNNIDRTALLNRTRNTLVAALRGSFVRLRFQKADGSMREMRATLMPGVLAAMNLDRGNGGGSQSAEAIRVVEAIQVPGGVHLQWRAFRLDRLVSFDPIVDA